jgi:hypothetical protein
MEAPRLTHEQLQTLMEYISAQVMCGVLEHEARVHNPNNPNSARAVNIANDTRKKYIEHLRGIMGPKP